MKLLSRCLALLLAALLPMGCAGAQAEPDDGLLRSAWEAFTGLFASEPLSPEEEAAEEEARWERLRSFATVAGLGWDDEEDDPSFAFVPAGDYAAEQPDAPRDYALVECLYLEDFTQAQFEEILLRVPQLRELRLRGCALEDLSPLQDAASLELLDLEWQPGLLEPLAAVPRLNALELFNVSADADLTPLATLTGLESLWLSFQRETIIRGPLPLERLPKLRILTLDTWLGAVGFLPDLPRLTEFHTNAAIDLALLRHTPSLRVLTMDCVPTDADLSSLTALIGLEDLRIVIDSSFTDEYVMPELPPLPHLRSLAYYDSYGGWWSSLPTLPDLPMLTDFSTNTPFDLALLRHTPMLRVLDIPCADDFTPLRELETLEEIYIDYHLPEDWSPLYALPALRLLQIDSAHAYPPRYLEQLEALHVAMPNLEIVLYYY